MRVVHLFCCYCTNSTIAAKFKQNSIVATVNRIQITGVWKFYFQTDTKLPFSISISMESTGTNIDMDGDRNDEYDNANYTISSGYLNSNTDELYGAFDYNYQEEATVSILGNNYFYSSNGHGSISGTKTINATYNNQKYIINVNF